MQKPAFQKITRHWLERSAGVKVFVLGVLFLILMIPTQWILGLVREREIRHGEVIGEVSSKWGREQSLIGPMLAVPYQERWVDEDGKSQKGKKVLYLLPRVLNIRGDIAAQTRRRSIYNVTLYENQLSLQGEFSLDALRESKIPQKDWLLKESRLVIAVSDLKGIQDPLRIQWEGQEVEPKIGTLPPGMAYFSALEARLPVVSADSPSRFSVHLAIRGSRGFFVAPVGGLTRMALKSAWPHPSFDGFFLPDSRTISPSGFSAEWSISHLNRELPQVWSSDEGKAMYPRFRASAFGVVLTQPVNHYSKSERSTKYAGLFVVLIFSVFFLSEILAGRLFHPVQYLMVGFALSLFYLLLLSLSEFFSFAVSYGIAAGMIVALLTTYVQAVFRSRAFSLRLALLLAGLYGFLYSLLQLEDQALLIGSLALFVALGWVMLASRKMEWYREAGA